MPEDKQPDKSNNASPLPGGKKTFDVTPPGKAPAAPTSKPVIVGHGPMAGDPMMADPDTKLDKEGAPSDGVPISVLTKKLKIQPLHDNIAPEEKTKPAPESSEIKPEPSAETESETKKPTAEPAPEPPKPSAPLAPEAVLTPPEPKEDKKTDTTDTPAPIGATVTFSDNPMSPPETTDVTDEKPAEPAPAAPEQSAAPDAPESEPKPASPEEAAKAAAKAADEEAAKQAQYTKVIDSKQYFVPVNAVRRKRSMRMLVIGAVLIIVAVLACINFMLDAGTLTLPINVPHTHLIKQ